MGSVEQRLSFDLLRGQNAAGGVRGLVRRTALRAMQPYTYPQRELDRALALTIHKLNTDVELLRSAGERDRDRIARLERQLREPGSS